MNLPRPSFPAIVRRAISSLLALSVVLLSAPAALASGVHPGDKLDVVVFDHPDISASVIVSNDGAIFLPLVGRVQAQGREPQQIARVVEQELEQYVYSPAVDVRVLSESNTAYWSGVTTGSITLQPSETLAMAVLGAKLPDYADLTRVTLHCAGCPTQAYNLVAMQTTADTTPLLSSGSVINVPAKPVVVRVSGAVKAPATAYLDNDEPLGLALQSVQSADNANVQYVQVLRDGQTYLASRGGGMLALPGRSGDQLIVPAFANVTVLGLASKPGPIVLKGDQSLATALALAGGAAKGADLGRVVVITPGADGKERVVDYNAFMRGNAAQNPQLADGDMVYVPAAANRISPKMLLVIALLVAKKAGLDVTKLLK